MFGKNLGILDHKWVDNIWYMDVEICIIGIACNIIRMAMRGIMGYRTTPEHHSIMHRRPFRRSVGCSLSSHPALATGDLSLSKKISLFSSASEADDDEEDEQEFVNALPLWMQEAQDNMR